MMKYFYLRPALPGEMGPNTILDHGTVPPTVLRLHYVLDVIPDDPIMTSFLSYVVTEEAKLALLEAGLTGFRIDEVEISTSEYFEYNSGDEKLGQMFWLRVEGKAFQDDFGIISNPHELVISQRARDVFEGIGLVETNVLPAEQ